MDNLKGPWYGIVYTWPAMIVLDKGANQNSIIGTIKFFQTDK